MKTETFSALSAPRSAPGSLSRGAIVVYGVVSYAVGMFGLCWLIAATLGLVPFTGGPVALGSTGGAIAFNLGFLVLFGVQHAIMARPAFKAVWTQIIPPATERSTFVLVTGLIVSATMWLWQPLPTVVWSADGSWAPILVRSIGVLGWLYLLLASFAIDHFELFGLKHVWRHYQGAETPHVPFVMGWMYRYERHPIMTGMLVGLWCTPTMTVGHLVLAAGLTAYMVIGVSIEERTLVAQHGESYRAYQRLVPALLPRPGRRKAASRR